MGIPERGASRLCLSRLCLVRIEGSGDLLLGDDRCGVTGDLAGSYRQTTYTSPVHVAGYPWQSPYPACPEAHLLSGHEYGC